MSHYPYRHLAKITIETETPLAIGSGAKDLFTDHLVARDANHLPYIPGTAIAGIIRHALRFAPNSKPFFGYGASKGNNDGNKNGGNGSEIIFSSAQIIDANGKAVETLLDESTKSDFLKNFDALPVRQHVRIGQLGTAEDGGKFDEEVVWKGTRFAFEIELLSATEDRNNFTNVLREISSSTFRIGSGTRKGFGQIKIIECKTRTLYLHNAGDLSDYIAKTASLNDPFWKNSTIYKNNDLSTTSDEYYTYTLTLKPDAFFLFSSGFGEGEADIAPVYENFIEWSNKNEPTMSKRAILIPATSVKGALRHRFAFHYNKLCEYFADVEEDSPENPVPAISVEELLFGYVENSKKENNDISAVRGNVIISDVIQPIKTEKSKLFNHVAIDRFTGGSFEGALFSENTLYAKNTEFQLTFIVKKTVLDDEEANDENIKEAFELALQDIANGQLPLGGRTTHGLGAFTGTITRNNEEIYKYV